MDIIAYLEKRNNLFWIVTGISFIIVIGILDYLTGYEMAFSLFYLFPVTLLTWFAGRRIGFAASLASALMWLTADIASGNTYSRAVMYWNGIIRFSFFVIVTLLLSALRRAHEREKELARSDSLTGAANTRSFSELVHMEMERAQRNKRPFTLAYVDLDNFKAVNDHFGHSTGDRVLSTIVSQAKSQLRKVDVVARLGGDEFAFLMPETDQPAAQAAIQRVQRYLLDEMLRNKWPVTFSIGVLTCQDIPASFDELLKCADDVMYSVKNNGKDSVHFAIYEGACNDHRKIPTLPG